MISSKHRFTLEMQTAHSQIAIPVTVGDTGKILYISLTDGGKPHLIPDGSLAMLTIYRPTGSFLQEFCAVQNNATIIYDFLQNENTASVVGIHTCELTLYGSVAGGVVSTSWFTIVVSDRVVNSDNIELSDEDQSAIDAIIKAEATRQIAETERVRAESIRVSAEDARASAEETRAEAEAERASAKNKLDQAIVRANSLKGIESIVKTATSGLVDTYTITYTDKSTSRYTVRNGKDGEDYIMTEADKQDIVNSVLANFTDVSEVAM